MLGHRHHAVHGAAISVTNCIDMLSMESAKASDNVRECMNAV